MNTRLLIIALCLIAGAAGAQTAISNSESLAFDRPESWAMQYFSSATLFSGLSPPEDVEPGALAGELELGTLPRLSSAQSTVGFNGTKPEDLNKIPLLARPRVMVGLPAKLSLTVGWIPPVPINGAQANLLAASLGRPLVTGSPFQLGARAYGQLGTVSGDFTCPADAVAAGNDPARNPSGCTSASKDNVQLRYVGFELSSGYRIEQWHGLTPHVALAGNWMDNAFNVHAQYGGFVDNSRLTASGFTFSGTAGAGLPITKALYADLGAFYSPLNIKRMDEPRRTDGFFNVRGLISYRFF